jgi:hypothetical protein
MRLRLALTLDIERRQPDGDADRVEQFSAQVEAPAEPRYLGFAPEE